MFSLTQKWKTQISDSVYGRKLKKDLTSNTLLYDLSLLLKEYSINQLVFSFFSFFFWRKGIQLVF